MAVGQVALLMIIVPVYGRLVARLPRLRLIRLVTWFFVACVIVFYLLARLSVPLGIPYFLWIGVFNVMIIAQFWAFANDFYTKAEGERLFPIVGFGASLGAVFGSVVASWLIGSVGIYEVMLVAGIGLVLQFQITSYVDRHRPAHTAPADMTASISAKSSQQGNAFALFFRNHYLVSIGVMVLTFYLLDTTSEYIVGTIVKQRATELVATGQSGGLDVSGVIGRFYSRYFALINTIGLLLQLFVVSRVVKYLGVGKAVAIQPALYAASFVTIAFGPSLGLILAGCVTTKSTDYSLNNTVRNMLFLPCTREEKYSAKQMIDSLFMRLGDVMSAGLVFVGTTMVGLTAAGFANVCIALAIVSFGLAVVVGRGYFRRTAEPRLTAAHRPSLRSAS
jgi:ATP:ADP antiporter, AAA family